MFKRKKGDAAELKGKIEEKDGEFKDFNIFEYNLFWILNLLIVLFIIAYLGGNVQNCLERFFQMINPANWF